MPCNGRLNVFMCIKLKAESKKQKAIVAINRSELVYLLIASINRYNSFLLSAQQLSALKNGNILRPVPL